MSDKLGITWCGVPTRARALATFFAQNVGPEYISHSELQGARALSATEWRHDLPRILYEEIEPRLSATVGAPPSESKPIAIAEYEGKIVALAFITFEGGAPVPFAIVEDLIVAPSARGKGVGKAMLDWIADEARARKIGRLFLESGLTNERAHAFFEREDFHPTSVVMMRSLK